MSPLTLLLLIAAPAPLPRPAVIESIVTAPDAPQRAAEQIRSLDSIERALALAFSPDEYRGKSPDWVRERLRVEVIRDGSALRLTMSDCNPVDAVTILDALIQEYLCERIPNRKKDLARMRRALLEARLREKARGIDENPERERKITQEFLRTTTNKQEVDAIILLQPCRVRGS
jgi:hypothetical protein